MSPRNDRGPPAGRVPHQAGGGDGRHPTDGALPFGGVSGGGLPDKCPALPADVSTPPVNRLSPQAGGGFTPARDSRFQGGGRQAPPPADGQGRAGGESVPPTEGQLQAGGAQPSSTECRPPAATVHPPSIPTLPSGTLREAPGQAPEGTPAAGHDQEAGHDQATDQNKLAAASGASLPVEQ